MALRTEDQVRNQAGISLGFIDGNGDNVETTEFLSGVGQLTTFIQLGNKLGTTDFAGISDKPDGWFLPYNPNGVAIVLETKSEKEDLSKKKWEKELVKNIEILQKHYSKVAGILYNGKDCRVFMNLDEVPSPSSTLQRLDYYTHLFLPDTIDKGRIYELTKKINNCLHKEFGVKNLNHRMIFTACALVAVKEGAILHKGTDYSLFHQTILNQLSKSLKEAKKQNEKLDLLCEVYSEIKMNTTNNQSAIDNFIDWVNEISDLINSDKWNGEDVMAIFFNEFNRYKGKSERGQVFTPDHITSFMYRLLNVTQSDVILDAACGSGAFLVKSMCNMVKEAGGINTKKATEIKAKQLYGIEFDREIYALACANMLIHKDGKTNLEQLDSRTEDASKWIRSISVKLEEEPQAKSITKVLMNPPFERAYGCMTIVKNVLDSVPVGTMCAFILPDKKLEKDLTDKKYGNKVLKEHTLTTIVKLPEKIFTGVTTSIFVFESGKPQNGKNIIGYYIEEDGLETVKNQGRQDIRNKWGAIEDYWIKAIYDGNDSKYNTRQIINPSEHLSYQMPEKPFEICEEDFLKTMMDYEMFKRGIDVKVFGDGLLKKIVYASDVVENENQSITVTLKGGTVDDK
ncbi:MAG: N-6 DNA methylase [Eubacteriales bacterium]|nr:N-6 DNA methylase [Lachnospiraceae bacterium]MDO4978256.1 N-6 DNA methylase [Eubacteriales bacterium]